MESPQLYNIYIQSGKEPLVFLFIYISLSLSLSLQIYIILYCIGRKIYPALRLYL